MAQNNFIDAKQLVDKLTAAFYEHDKAISQSVTKLADLNKQYAKLPSDYTKSLKEIETSQKNITATSERLNKVEKETQRQRLEELRLAKQREKAFDKYETQLARETASKQRNISKMIRENSEYSKLVSKMNEVGKTVQNLNAKKAQGIKLSNDEQKELKQSQIEFDKYNGAVLKADAAINRHQRNVGNYGTGLNKMTGILRTTIAAFGIYSGLQVAREIFNQIKEIDSLNKALLKVTETQGKFNSEQRFLVALAEESGTELLGLQKAYTKFLAAAKTTNLTTEQTQNIFRQTAKAGAVLGLSSDDIAGSIRALEQILSKGKVQAEEIRGQLGERLPGAFQILAQSMGLTTAELSKQLELGNVISEEVLPKFAEELEKVYGLDTVKRVDTVIAAQNRLSNEWTLFITSVENGEGIISQVFKTIVSEIAETIKWYRELNNEGEKLNTGGYNAELKDIASQSRITGEAESEIAKRRLQQRKDNLKAAKDELSIKQRSLDIYKEETSAIKKVFPFSQKYLAVVESIKGDISNKKANISIIEGQIAALEQLTNVSEEEIKVSVEGSKDKIKSRAKEIAQLLVIVDALENLNRINEKMKKDAKEGLDKTTVDTSGLEKENAELLKQASLREKAKRDAIFASQQIEDAFVSLGNTLGIQEQTTRDLFDGIKNGFLDAGEAAEAFGALAVDALNSLTNAQRNQMEQRIEQLETQRDIEIEYAGESTGARALIEERFARKKADLQRKQAIREKNAAIIQANINIATSVIKTFAELGWPGGIVAGAIISALGLAQLAIIASQPIPQFEKGVRNFEGGTAMINEKRQEVVTTPDGGIYKPKGKNLLVNLPKGSDVYKSEADFQRSLNSQLEGNGISYMPTPKEKGITAMEVETAMRRAIGSSGDNYLTIDKNGFTSYIQKGLTKTTLAGNRVKFKGKIV